MLGEQTIEESKEIKEEEMVSEDTESFEIIDTNVKAEDSEEINIIDDDDQNNLEGLIGNSDFEHLS